jgi:4-aminobutyrate aminotransferase/(S)-3-amino-2-methylpropionate transaminase
MAKSLAAGLPLGSVTGRTEIMDSPHIGGLGGTFSGNPVACRAALAVLDLIKEENLLERAQKLGEQMSATLTGCMEKFKIIGEVRGLGPMIGIELVKDRRTKKPAVDETKNIIASCREDGLLVISCGMYSNVVRVLAPLVISDDQLNRGLAILERAIQKVDQNL